MTATKRYTLSDIRRINEQNGYYFFSRETMRFFGDTMKSFGVRNVDGRVFVYRRKYGRRLDIKGINSIWEFSPQGGDINILRDDDPIRPRLNID